MKKIFMVSLLVISIFIQTSCSKSEKEVLYLFNWGDYIGEGVIEDFEKETGIRVIQDYFDSNELMYTSVKNKEGEYDVLIPSEYMIERLINEGMLEKLNFDNIPNYENIDERFKNLVTDPNDEYMVSYMWGTLGIMYNKTMVDEVVDSWDILWDEKYTNKVFMYDSVRDSFAVSLIRLGYSVNSVNASEIEEAKNELIKQLPIKRAYLTDPIKDSMAGGEGALAVVYSGDAIVTQNINPDIDYIIPKEGSNLFFDGMVIPKGAKNKENGEKFINYMCRPDIAARNSEFIGYSTTNKEALKLMDETLVGNPIYWPDDSVFTDLEVFIDLGDFKKIYDEAWIEIFLS